MWLGNELEGTLDSIGVSASDGATVYNIAYKDTSYPCRIQSRFGKILLDKTIELQKGRYVKETKTEIDYAMDDIQRSFDKLKEMHENKFPKRTHKELKEVVKTMKTQLTELQRLVTAKK